MTGGEVSILPTLLQAGAAGAVIVVVVYFLRFIKERDAEWRSFFTAIREGDSVANARLTNAIEKLVLRIEGVEKGVDELKDEFRRHDATEMEFLRGFASASADRKTGPRKGAKTFGE